MIVALGLGVCVNPFTARGAEPVSGLLLISVDALRTDHVGAYGAPPVATPALDALAAAGALVESAYTAIPATGPAHASLMTGRYPWHHGSQRNAVPLDASLPVLAEAVRSAGFATAGFVSSDNLHRRFGFHKGFDSYVFEATEPLGSKSGGSRKFFSRGEDTVRAAMTWVTAHSGAPFFLWVHFAEPHPPHRAPEGFELPPSARVEAAHPSPAGAVKRSAKLAATVRAYRAEVAYVDVQIGRLVDRLRLLGRLEETAVIVTSGQGEGLGEHGSLGHGSGLYEELVRVPLVVRGPGVPAGRRLVGLTQLEDLAPTIRAWVGAAAAPASDGVDLLPWLRGDVETSPRSAVFGQRRSSESSETLYYLRRGAEKWVGRVDEPGYRYRLEDDPAERAPVQADGMPPELREALGLGAAPAPADARKAPGSRAGPARRPGHST